MKRFFCTVGIAAFALVCVPIAHVFAQTPATPPAASATTPPIQTPATAPAAPPVAAGLAPPAPVSALVASVPFQYVGDKVAIGVLIDGQGPFSIGIDSGSETLTVTQKVVDAAKLSSATGTVEVSGTSGGYVPVSQATVAQLTIGAATIDKPFCTVTSSPIPLDGYLGAPLFNNYVVEIDPGSHIVSLYRPDTFLPAPTDVAVPIELGFHRVPVVHGTIGGIDATFEVDTGSASPAELGPAIVAAKDLTHKFNKIGSVGMVSAHGPTASDVYSLNGLTIGPNGAAGLNGPIPTVFLDPSLPAPDTWDGRIGAPLLKNFVITFDYAHAKLYIRSVATAPPATPEPGNATPAAAPSPAGH